MSDEGGGITSPEGVLMLTIAVILDAISLIPAVNEISEISGIIIIGLWILIRGGGFDNILQKASKTLKRFGITVFVEAVPVVSIIPCWTWMVYKTVNNSSGPTEIQEEDDEGKEKPTPQSVSGNANSQPDKKEVGSTAA